MKKLFLLLVLSLLSVAASYAIAPIVGSSSTCAGSSVTVSDATSGGTWTSSNSLVASIGLLTGDINGVAAGVATITYTVGMSYVTMSFTVTR